MAMPDTQQYAADASLRLVMAVKRFRSRLREEAGTTSTGWTVLQFAILSRIIDEGPATAASLATAEHVTQQAVAQSLAPLKAAGLVRAKPDARDRRKNMISVTADGRRLVESIRASRDTWVIRAIEETVAPEDRPMLEQAIDLLQRLADVELRRGMGIR